LIFPHHENEIAQSEAANDAEFARFWMHIGYLNINNEKMSKSKNNFFTVRDKTSQYDPEVLRFFMLTSHYRNPINFSHDLLEQSKSGFLRLSNTVDNLRHLLDDALDRELSDEERAYKEKYDEYKRRNRKYSGRRGKTNCAFCTSGWIFLRTKRDTSARRSA